MPKTKGLIHYKANLYDHHKKEIIHEEKWSMDEGSDQ